MLIMTELDADEFDEIEIDATDTPIKIEVIANRKIDFGIVDDNKAFQKKSQFKKYKWFPAVSGPIEFAFNPKDKEIPYWLIIWNSGKKEAVACYQIIQSKD